MRFTKLFFIVVVFVLPWAGLAGISVEPYGSYGFAFKNKKLFHLLSPGARLGYTKWGLMMGVDGGLAYYSPVSISKDVQYESKQAASMGFAQLSSPSVTSLNNQDNAFWVITVGPSVSFGLPFIVDAYASLVWAQGSGKDFKKNTKVKIGGAGVKTGISYLNLPFISINLEFQALNYFNCITEGEDCKEGSTGASLIGMNYVGLLSVSFPINTGIL